MRLDQAEPIAAGEALPQELCALDPWQRSDVVAAELEQIKRNEMELAGRHGVDVERRSAYRREVLDGSAILGAEGDELAVDDGPKGGLGERLSSEPWRSPRVVPRRD